MGGVQRRVQLRMRQLAPGRRAVVHRLSPAARGLLAPAGGVRDYTRQMLWLLQQLCHKYSNMSC